MSDINPSVAEAQKESSQADFNISDILSKLIPQAPSESKSTGDIFSSLLSNPDLLSRLPQLISVIGPLMNSLSQSQASPQEPNTPAHKSTESTVEISSKSHFGSDSRAALLCAMKPYLCRDRQNAIDYIIKLSRLGELLKTL